MKKQKAKKVFGTDFLVRKGSTVMRCQTRYLPDLLGLPGRSSRLLSYLEIPARIRPSQARARGPQIGHRGCKKRRAHKHPRGGRFGCNAGSVLTSQSARCIGLYTLHSALNAQEASGIVVLINYEQSQLEEENHPLQDDSLEADLVNGNQQTTLGPLCTVSALVNVPEIQATISLKSLLAL